MNIVGNLYHLLLSYMPVNYSFPVHNWSILVYVLYVISSHWDDYVLVFKIFVLVTHFFIMDFLYNYIYFLSLVFFAAVESNFWLYQFSLYMCMMVWHHMGKKEWTSSFCLFWSTCSLNKCIFLFQSVLTGLCESAAGFT